MERLNFQRRKNTLEGRSLRYKRMLSSFAYGRVMTFMRSRGHRSGVQVIGVNPAFSSVMGRVKYMEPYGLTVHQAAAMVLARRGLGLSERLPGGEGFRIPDGWGGHVTLARPVRKRVRHVWQLWGQLSGDLRRALAARYRSLRDARKGVPDPVLAVSGIVPG